MCSKIKEAGLQYGQYSSKCISYKSELFLPLIKGRAENYPLYIEL